MKLPLVECIVSSRTVEKGAGSLVGKGVGALVSKEVDAFSEKVVRYRLLCLKRTPC